MSFFKLYFLEFGLLDVIDILIVAFIIYQFFLLMRGSRAVTMLVGLGVLLFLAFISTWLNMNSLQWLITRLGTVWVIAFLVVFQPELRNALTRLGNTPFFGKIVSSSSKKVLDEVIRAVELLSEAKVGALIAIKREVGLKGYEETGKKLNSQVNADLLVTIFTPRTPLHDGAVIIENDLIIAAACELPLTTNPRYQRTLGMRHRAGVGLSEETDALVVLVSEETGGISLAVRGHLRKNLNVEKLGKLLEVSMKGRTE
ncbi:MAG TPA: TIGR00159 family protein [candidate division Zixibacteria bacterium]|nr:TIGR00159 family protein [candidate division Zixibacteria bacterium]